MQTPPDTPPPSDEKSANTDPSAFVPMADDRPTLATTFDTLLKKPGALLHHLHHADSATVIRHLLITTVIGLSAFGLMTGWFSGGTQLWAAPVKIVLGTFAAALICLPSLYIFACLSGYDVRARNVVGVLAAVLCLLALLLLGFTPVVWVFSQSTQSLAFMGALVLVFWLIAGGFGISLLFKSARHLGARRSGHLAIWSLVFLVVSLQMSTTLRPIIGTSERLLSGEKKFFLEHWFDSLTTGSGTPDAEAYPGRGQASSGAAESPPSQRQRGDRGWE